MITFKTKTLQNAFKLLSPIFNNQEVLQSLQCVKLVSNSDTVTLTASNLSLTVEIVLDDVEILGDLEILVQGRELQTIISNADYEEIIFRYDCQKMKLFVSFGEVEASLPCLHIEEFPQRVTDNYLSEIVVDSNDFQLSINKVIDFVRSDKNHVLNNVCFDLSESMRLIACCGRSLASSTLQTENSNYVGEFLISENGVRNIQRCVKYMDNLTISIFEKSVLFKGENVSVTVSLTNGKYKDVSPLITEINKERNMVELDFSELKGFLPIANLYRNQYTEEAILIITSDEIDFDLVTFESKSKDLGKFTNTLKCSDKSGDISGVKIPTHILQSVLSKLKYSSIKLIDKGNFLLVRNDNLDDFWVIAYIV